MRRCWIGAVLGLALALAQTHTVAPGDTLYSIARRYGTTVEELVRLNGLESFLLKPGQVLLLPKKEAPGPVHVVAPGDTLYSIARRYGTTVEELLRLNGLESFLLKPGQVLLLPKNEAPGPVHVVAPGDTLYSIARRYGTTVEELSRLNGLESSEIKVGQVLKLPEKAPSGPSAPPSPEGPPPTPSDEGEAKDTLDPESPLLKAVLKYLGVPYKYGANSPLALDCSAFVAQVYAELGVALPRTSREQYASLPPAEPLLPGDLVFFSFGGKEVDHVGIYLGRGVFAHASSYGSRVVIESLEAPFYRKTYRGARRVTASREPPPGPSAGR